MDQGIEIRWSRKAIRQVKAIGDYIEVDSPWQAQRIVNLLIGCPERLRFSKNLGKIVREYSDPTIRELSVYAFRIIYRIKTKNLVEVAAVIHGRQLLRPDMLG